MASIPQRGCRLLPTTIDLLAVTEPNRPWISVPRDDDDLEKGFIDITFQQLSNAINHAAAWLHQKLGMTSSKFETIAYEGPPDARCAIIAVAATKVGRKILSPFPFAPAHIKGHLLEQTHCTVFVYAETSSSSVQEILNTRPHMFGIIAPPLEEWITEKPAKPYAFDTPWNEAADDPWLIFHTSGTTGFPKPIIYTHRMMTSFDVAATLPDADQDTQASYLVNRRLVGMGSALQGPTWLGATLVLGPAKPLNPTIADQVIQHGRVEGLVAPPVIIKALSVQPASLQRLRALKFVQWAGAPLDQATGDILKYHVKLSPAIGTTEAGPYFTLLCEDPEDWEYYRFRSGQGIVFEQRSAEFWELVFRKQKDARWQQIFLLYPELEEYATKDLFRKHPSKEGLWLYSGRSDDMIKLANGNGLHASSIEAIVVRDPTVQAVLVGGDGRNRPFILIQPSEEVFFSAKDKEAILSAVWPAVEAANLISSELAKIKKELIVIADPKKPFRKSGKETLLRRERITAYKDGIDMAYRSLE